MKPLWKRLKRKPKKESMTSADRSYSQYLRRQFPKEHAFFDARDEGRVVFRLVDTPHGRDWRAMILNKPRWEYGLPQFCVTDEATAKLREVTG